MGAECRTPSYLADDLVTYQDQKLFSPEQLVKPVQADKPGHKVERQLVREGKVESYTVTLGERPSRSAASQPVPAPWWQGPWWQEFPKYVAPGERPRRKRSESENKAASSWESFDSLTLKKLDDNHYRAEIGYMDEAGQKQYHQFEGTREEIRSQIQAGLELFVDEDQLTDDERWHTTEQVAHVVFGQAGSALLGEASVDRSETWDAAATLKLEQAEPAASSALADWAKSSDASSLPAIELTLADLPGSQLGFTIGRSITLDVDGAGIGWFVDETPDDDAEFSAVGGRVSLIAGDDSPATKCYDLLTVLAHELGHVLGLGHTEGDQLMADTLVPGIRRGVVGSPFELLQDDLLDAVATDVSELWARLEV